MNVIKSDMTTIAIPNERIRLILIDLNENLRLLILPPEKDIKKDDF
jgi:hypothetical protein